MMTDLNQLAKKYMEGEWLYNPEDKTVKKTFASNKELSALQLIDTNGYLDAAFKVAIIQALGPVVSNQIVGPFGDNDIFSGDIVEEEIFYNIEIHDVSEATITALKNLPNVILKS